MIYLFITAGIFLLDLIIKSHIDKKYALDVMHPHFKDKIILEKYYNKGAALNLLNKQPKFLRLIHTVILVIVGTIYYFSLRYSKRPLSKMGLSLLLGGGFSNLFDRYTKGYVVDYFRINIGPKRFRRIIFNISDFFIFIGALLSVIGSDEIL